MGWQDNGVGGVGRTTGRAIDLETGQGRCVSGRPGPGPGPGIGPLARANLVWDASERARWAAAAARITRLFTHTPDAPQRSSGKRGAHQTHAEVRSTCEAHVLRRHRARGRVRDGRGGPVVRRKLQKPKTELRRLREPTAEETAAAEQRKG